MKIQSTAIIKALKVDGTPVRLEDNQVIELEFSAIDTGGGFKDPMVDYSISFSGGNTPDYQEREVQLLLSDPNDSNRNVEVSYTGVLSVGHNQINGRITEQELSNEAIGFIFGLQR